MAQEILPAIRKDSLSITAYIDERPHTRGTFFAGKPVIDASQITKHRFDYLLVACRPADEISARMLALNIPASKIVSMDFEYIILAHKTQNPEERRGALSAYLSAFGLEQAFDLAVLSGSPWLARLLLPSYAASLRRFCPTPFYNAWIEHDYAPEYSALQAGDVNLCCWCNVDDLSATAGNITDEATFDGIWNSERAQKFRASILDNSFKYCLKDICHLLKYNKLPFSNYIKDEKYKNIIANNQTIAPLPTVIDLNYDESCNIACPQCRKNIIMARGDKFTRIKKIHDSVVRKLHNPQRLAITSGGDALASPVFLPFLQNFDEERFPDTKITLRTNALLFNEKIWKSIKKSHTHIDIVIISIDAATKKTYSIVRKPGNFNVLLKNLEVVKRVKDNEVRFSLDFAFCVQKRNFREMGEFVSFAERYGADRVSFGLLTPNGCLVGDAFLEHAVHLESHPEYPEFIRQLEDPRLKKTFVALSITH
jgi:hypothetical protein